MARGWESKSVDDQIEAASSDRLNEKKRTKDPESPETRRRRESLLLARRRVVDQLQNATDARYKEMMDRALADLDRLIAQEN